MKMTFDTQGSLFGEGKMTPPMRSSAPDLKMIRGRLNNLLKTLRDAETMPLSEKDARIWRAVIPNMTKWLPEIEGIEVRSTFHKEMERLGVCL